MTNIINLPRQLSLAEALADIQRRPVEEHIAIKLAEAWGWPRNRAGRQIADWRAAGVIPGKSKPKRARQGRVRRTAQPKSDASVVYGETAANTPLTGNVATPAEQLEPPVPISSPAAMPAPQPVEIKNLPVVVPPRPTPLPRQPRAARDVLVAIIFASAAIALAVIGVVINCRYWGAFGRSSDAVLSLEAIGVSVDTLTLILPLAAFRLWGNRRYLGAIAAWCFFLGFLVMTVLATSGFAALNVGDAVAARDLTQRLQTSLSEKWQSLRAERAAITEARSVTELDQQLIAEQAKAGRTYYDTNGCREVDRSDLRRCNAIIDLRRAKGQAERRDELRAELDRITAQLHGEAPVQGGDPGADMVSRIIPWLTRDLVTPSAFDIQRLRIVVLSLSPAAGGILLALAELIARGRRT